MATVERVRYTPEDLLLIDDRPMPELVDGELVEREVGQKSDGIANRIARLIGNYVDEHGLGFVNGSQGSYQIFTNHPERVRIPDVSFTREERLDPNGLADGHARIAPDLVIEVVSPRDLVSELEAKIDDYLSAGVPMIWIVHPETRRIRVYYRDEPDRVFHVGDTIEGRDILVGYRCEVGFLLKIR